jgi:hypothetical protein
MRFDRDRLNMLYGQLASKVKYQLLRRVPPGPRQRWALSKAAKPAAKPAPAVRQSVQLPPSGHWPKRAAKPGKEAPPVKKKARGQKKAALARRRRAGQEEGGRQKSRGAEAEEEAGGPEIEAGGAPRRTSEEEGPALIGPTGGLSSICRAGRVARGGACSFST